jgi:hypothetical protein
MRSPIVLALSLLTTVTLAHSWYPPECCSEGDCRPVPCAGLNVETKRSGHGESYVVITYTEAGKVYSMMRDKEKPSPDAFCHACFQRGTFNMRCVFTPRNLS